MVEELYIKMYEELLHWSYSMTGRTQIAEDLIQEAFFRAMKNETLLQELSFPQCRAWIYRTIKNLYIDYVRKAAFETVTEMMPERISEENEYDIYDNMQLLSILSDEEKLLFVMRYMEGYNSSELGSMFSLSPATVRSRLASARKKLRKEWDGGNYGRDEYNE